MFPCARSSGGTRRSSRSTRRGASSATSRSTAGATSEGPSASRRGSTGALGPPDRELVADLREAQVQLVLHPLELPALPDPGARPELPAAPPGLALVVD